MDYKRKKIGRVQNEFENKFLPKNLNRTNSGLEKYSGAWGNKQKLHLLRRTTFSAKKSHVDLLINKTLDESIALLLKSIATPNPPLNNYQSSYADPTGVAFGSTWVNSAYGDGTVDYHRRNSLRSWLIGSFINQSISLNEKMTLFWHNLIATEISEYNDARVGFVHFSLFQKYSLGNFKSLIKDISLDSAMLRYLNGQLNTKTAPDENFARELQELFTLGKGVDSKYTEDDIKQAAKVLTGWRVNNTQNPPTSYFDASRHDIGNKTFSSFYGNKTILGRNNSNAGIDELNDLLNMIFDQQEVAKYICRRIYSFFIYYHIDNNVETNIITPLANIFRNSNYEIKPVLEKLFSSEHFFDQLNFGCVIKSPLDFSIGLVNEFKVAFPDSSDIVRQYRGWQNIYEFARNNSQSLADPPNVAGWPAYYQEPQFYQLWINSDTLPKRNIFSDSLISNNGYSIGGIKLVIDPIAFAKQFTTPSDPNLLIKDSLEFLYANDITTNQFNFLKSILLSNQSSDHYWTEAWNNYISNPSNATFKEQVLTRLQSLYKYLMNLGEYQLS